MPGTERISVCTAENSAHNLRMRLPILHTVQFCRLVDFWRGLSFLGAAFANLGRGLQFWARPFCFGFWARP